jgi:hypothetical protein
VACGDNARKVHARAMRFFAKAFHGSACSWAVANIRAVEFEEIKCPIAQAMFARRAQVWREKIWDNALIACGELAIGDS